MVKKGQGQSHGKIILMGEHAVVYGQAAIAIPFPSVQVKVKIESSPGPMLLASDFYCGPLNQVPADLEAYSRLIDRIGQDLNRPLADFTISIHSQIPTGRGLGSSAAVAGALVQALFDYFNQHLTADQWLAYIDLSEQITHGHPSGLDARICQANQAIYYIKGQQMTPFNLQMDAYLLVADTGQVGRTKESVAAVKALVDQDQNQSRHHLQALGDLTDQAYAAIQHNRPQDLGAYMTRAHTHLKALTVSNAQLDQLVQHALDQGALGAKLTGGGRGGCMIALCQDRQQADQIGQSLKAGLADTYWIYQLKIGEKDV